MVLLDTIHQTVSACHRFFIFTSTWDGNPEASHRFTHHTTSSHHRFIFIFTWGHDPVASTLTFPSESWRLAHVYQSVFCRCMKESRIKTGCFVINYNKDVKRGRRVVTGWGVITQETFKKEWSKADIDNTKTADRVFTVSLKYSHLYCKHSCNGLSQSVKAVWLSFCGRLLSSWIKLCWGPPHVEKKNHCIQSVLQKREQPDVTCGEVWTVEQVWQNVDMLLIKVLHYCPCFVRAGIVSVDEDVLGIGGWTQVFHMLDNFEYNCLGIVGTRDCVCVCVIFLRFILKQLLQQALCYWKILKIVSSCFWKQLADLMSSLRGLAKKHFHICWQCCKNICRFDLMWPQWTDVLGYLAQRDKIKRTRIFIHQWHKNIHWN